MRLPATMPIALLLIFLLLTACTSKEDQFIEAAKNENIEDFKKLAGLEIDVNAMDKDGMTALHFLAKAGNVTLSELLIQKGADPNLKNVEEKTPLFIAVENSHAGVVHVLVSSGADINLRAKNGSMPIHIAAKNGNLPIIKELTANGAQLEEKDNDGRLPASIADENGHEKASAFLVKAALYIKSAESAASRKDFFSAAEKYHEIGNLAKATSLYIQALNSPDPHNLKRCIIALSKTGTEDAISELKKREKDSDQETEKIIDFVLKRYREKKLKILMVSLGESGRRSIDGYLASVGIITELSQIKPIKKLSGFTEIFDKTIGVSKYSLKNIKLPTIKSSEDPPLHSLDREGLIKIRTDEDYDILITEYSVWNEYVNNIVDKKDQTPLKMDVHYEFNIYIPALEERTTYSYKFFHVEPSDYKRDSEKKLCRKNTALYWASKEADVMDNIETYFVSLF